MDEETRLESAETQDDWEAEPGDTALGDEDVIDGDGTQAGETAEETGRQDTDADQQLWTDGEADTSEAEAEEEAEPDQFTLKHLDEVKTVSRDEVVVLAQKGLDYDRIRQKHEDLSTEQRALAELCPNPRQTLSFLSALARQQGFANVDALLDETRAVVLAERDRLDLSVARGRVALDRKERALAEKESRLSGSRAFNDPAEAEKRAREKREGDFAAFIREYPAVSPESVPKEVWELYGQGGRTLVQAYEKIENKQLKALFDNDQKNAENRRRSTGSITSVGRSSPQDEFDRLWNSD